MAIIEAEALRDASLEGETVAVLGYGSQGRAQALNLADSGVDVVVGLRPGSASAERVQADGLPLATPDEAVARASLVAMLVPDEAQPAVYGHNVAPHLGEGGGLVFAHGFNIHYGHIQPREDLDVLLVAPSGIGEQLRARSVGGDGIAGFVAVHRNASGKARPRALDRKSVVE